MMKNNIHLRDVVEANNLLVSMGGEDQMPRIASAAIERSLELQHRVDRAIRYAEEAHSSSLHVKQVLRILDGSITLDDEMNEVIPEPLLQQQPLDMEPRLVRRPIAPPPPAPSPGGGLGNRTTAERKAFRDWAEANGLDLPLNKTVPQHILDQFDEATNGVYNKGPQTPKRKPHKNQGKLKPGHGLAGRSMAEREHMRDWLKEQGFDINPTGRIPQTYINHYDAAQAEIKRMQREARVKRVPANALPPQEDAHAQEQEQHAQGA